MFRVGDRVRSKSGIEGRIAAPNSSAAIQKDVRLSVHEAAPTWLVVTEDGEVRRFLETALEPIPDEIRRSGSLK